MALPRCRDATAGKRVAMVVGAAMVEGTAMTLGYICGVPTSYRPIQELWEFLARLRRAAVYEAPEVDRPTTAVKYACQGCGVNDRDVLVPARASLDEPIGPWLSRARQMCEDDHKLVSPDCLRRTYDMKVMMAGGVPGGALKQ